MRRRTASLAGGMVESVSGKKRPLRTWCLTELVALFLLGVMVTPPAEASKYFDKFNLDEAAEMFAKKMATDSGYLYNWVDLWYNNTHNRKHRVNREFQLTVTMGDMVLDNPEIKLNTKKVKTLYETTLEARTGQQAIMEVTKQEDVVKSSILETFNAFESNSTTTIEGGLPGFLKVSAGWGIEVILHKVKTDVSVSREQLSLAVNVTVPRRKRVTLTWIATTVETHIPWKVKVTLRGKFVANFKGIYGVGNHEKIYSIAEMAQWFPDELQITGQDEVVYMATGVLKDVKAEKVEVRVKEENLRKKNP